MNSSSDRRVLDEAGPDPNQSARDQQPIHKRPEGIPWRASVTLVTERNCLAGLIRETYAFSRLSRPNTRPLISNETIHSAALKRHANQQPGRLAFQLEARLGYFTIFSNVPATLKKKQFDMQRFRLESLTE
ncbi:MAG TPA: hypothetical protein DHU55_10050 [Blastocatellia bacterium]|nr:hypothetical protein [Blastocatellia bacterium]HCX30094.1 hypothetical protein [Blastocatellia bacterium]